MSCPRALEKGIALTPSPHPSLPATPYPQAQASTSKAHSGLSEEGLGCAVTDTGQWWQTNWSKGSSEGGGRAPVSCPVQPGTGPNKHTKPECPQIPPWVLEGCVLCFAGLKNNCAYLKYPDPSIRI